MEHPGISTSLLTNLIDFEGDILNEVKKNGVVWGKITKVLPRSGLLIELPGHRCGFAHVTELSDEHKENPLEEFKVKNFVKYGF